MPLKYLGRNRKNDSYMVEPINQLVNVPELQLTQRCQFCAYWEEDRDYSAMRRCIEKNKCGYESLLWAMERNGYDASEIQSDHFTPTSIVRQRKFSEVPRYLQYFTCDLEGYICNRLCQFYPQRIESEQSVAECANSNGCGQNGSFFRLLELFRPDLNNLPTFWGANTPAGYIMQYDGTLVPSSIEGGWGWNPQGLFVLQEDSGVQHRILLMIHDQPNAGCFLIKYDNNPLLYLFRYVAIAYQRVKPTDFVLRSVREDLWAILNSHGITANSIYNICPNLKYITWGSTGHAWVTSNDEYFEFVDQDKAYLVVINTIDTAQRIVYRFGSTGNTYLMSPYKELPPSKWRKVTLGAAPSGDYVIINLTSWSGSSSVWLRDIGVRESLFYDL